MAAGATQPKGGAPADASARPRYWWRSRCRNRQPRTTHHPRRAERSARTGTALRDPVAGPTTGGQLTPSGQVRAAADARGTLLPRPSWRSRCRNRQPRTTQHPRRAERSARTRATAAGPRRRARGCGTPSPGPGLRDPVAGPATRGPAHPIGPGQGRSRHPRHPLPRPSWRSRCRNRQPRTAQHPRRAERSARTLTSGCGHLIEAGGARHPGPARPRGARSGHQSAPAAPPPATQLALPLQRLPAADDATSAAGRTIRANPDRGLGTRACGPSPGASPAPPVPARGRGRQNHPREHVAGEQLEGAPS